jgi:hypothetical protein
MNNMSIIMLNEEALLPFLADLNRAMTAMTAGHLLV